jgi:hypothetical protein
MERRPREICRAERALMGTSAERRRRRRRFIDCL